MLEIITPAQFKTVPWKNGKGETTELAINLGGTLTYFDWRISIASVVENGIFSDFSDIDRNLVLIEGSGIKLTHDEAGIDNLTRLLDVATFDGACVTMGELSAGPIKDLNIMSRSGVYQAKVNTYVAEHSVELLACEHCFVYCLEDDANIDCKDQVLPAGHLLHVCNETIELTGRMMVVATLSLIK
jgi:environmental stress-induced protein Ves